MLEIVVNEISSTVIIDAEGCLVTDIVEDVESGIRRQIDQQLSLDSMPRGIQRVGRLVTVIDTISINVGRSF